MVAIPIKLREDGNQARNPLKELGEPSRICTINGIIASRQAMLGKKMTPLHDDSPDMVLMRHPEAHRLTKSQREELILRLGDRINDFELVATEATRIRVISEYLNSLRARGSE